MVTEICPSEACASRAWNPPQITQSMATKAKSSLQRATLTLGRYSQEVEIEGVGPCGPDRFRSMFHHPARSCVPCCVRKVFWLPNQPHPAPSHNRSCSGCPTQKIGRARIVIGYSGGTAVDFHHTSDPDPPGQFLTCRKINRGLKRVKAATCIPAELAETGSMATPTTRAAPYDSDEPIKHPLIEEIFSGKKGSSYFKLSN